MTKLEQSLKDRDLIDIGDKVTVFTYGYSFDGIVKYKPCATGDCWIFEEVSVVDKPNGNIQYVQNYIRITKYNIIEDDECPF